MYTEQEQAIIDEALEIVASKLQREPVALSSSGAASVYLKLRFGNYEHEVFAVVLLDNQHRVIAVEELFRGTIDGAAVYPREVVKTALQHNAAAVIFAHNHPSGVAEPSHADIAITRKLVQALETVEIRVLDHFIVSATDATSMSEKGLL